MPRSRTALAAAVVSALALTACGSSSEEPSADPSGEGTPAISSTPAGSSAAPLPEGSVEPSPDLSTITVTDTDQPEVTVPAPWKVATTQSLVLRPSTSGQVLEAASTVTINYVGVNGRTGEVFDSSYATGQAATFELGTTIPGFQTGLIGQQVGSRVLIGMTGEDGYAQGNAQAGIEAGDSLIFVVDILSASFPQPVGEAVPPAEGLPTVADGETGPEVTVPSGLVADTLVVQPLITGPGTAIAEDSTIVVKFRAWGAKSGNLVYDAWTPQEGPLANLIAGWKTGLLGQTAGSRVMLVVPAAEAFPNGDPEHGLEAGEGLVYVIDIVDVKAAAQ
ncbi:MAG: FKBP-type peptidyl-prolyl cis-trans isomerase [Propionibacteriaceae bacterium]|nr:FKBP-type peptidyl-prolyl cis-trans isomerase [Propionibacteriaceae bacterium]